MLLHSGLRLPRRVLVTCLFFVLVTAFLLLLSPTSSPFSAPKYSPSRTVPFLKPSFKAGSPKPAGSHYIRTVVLAAMSSDDTSWLELLPDAANISTAVYIVDNHTAPLHTPLNKGREGMAYFSYMIDSYDDLPDISIFMHSHRFAWHNSGFLNGGDAVEVITRLNSARVMREGYQNLRCEWGPGCPNWIRPLARREDLDEKDPETKPEQSKIADAWRQLFPAEPIPQVLAQPCCAQFALSKDRIHSISRPQLLYWRDWLATTPLSDHLSGRVMEYLWQYFFTGDAVHCPTEFVCMCDTYGMCFNSNKEYRSLFDLRDEIGRLRGELDRWLQDKTTYDIAVAMANAGMQPDKVLPKRPPALRDLALRVEIDDLETVYDGLVKSAFALGENENARDRIAGRKIHRPFSKQS